MPLSSRPGYPEPERYRLVQGRVLRGLGETHRAVEVFSNVINSWNTGEAPGGPMGRSLQAEIFYERGAAYLDVGDEARARADWEQAGELYPDWDKPARALSRLDLAAAEKLISDYLADNPPSGGPESPEAQKRLGLTAERLMTWASQQSLPGGKRIELHAVVPVNNSPDNTAPKVLLTDWSVVGGNELAYPQVHGVYWWANGLLHAQVQLYSVDADYHGLDQNHRLINARQADGKVAAIYDSAAFGSGSPVPVLYLWELGKDFWEIVWRSDADPEWRGFYGQIRFTGAGLDEFTLESDSWNANDGKDTIFHESNPGPHRQYLDTWGLKENGYQLKQARTLPSAYNTLVQLIYALSTGQAEAAKKLVTDAELVERAERLGLVQEPLGQGWMLSSIDRLQNGPLTIEDGAAAGVRVTFTQRDGQWLVDNLIEPKPPKK